MSLTFVEGDLEFDFSGALRVEKLDKPGRPMPPYMKAVDFVVEEEQRVLLIEVKDPSAPSIPDDRRAEVIRREIGKRSGDELINDDLAPKARHSYGYLHLMARDTKPFLFVLVDDTSALGIAAEGLPSFKDRLLARLRQEGEEPWVRRYVTDCVVVSPGGLSAYFAPYACRRVSASPTPPH